MKSSQTNEGPRGLPQSPLSGLTSRGDRDLRPSIQKEKAALSLLLEHYSPSAILSFAEEVERVRDKFGDDPEAIGDYLEESGKIRQEIGAEIKSGKIPVARVVEVLLERTRRKVN